MGKMTGTFPAQRGKDNVSVDNVGVVIDLCYAVAANNKHR